MQNTLNISCFLIMALKRSSAKHVYDLTTSLYGTDYLSTLNVYLISTVKQMHKKYCTIDNNDHTQISL